MNTAGVCLHFQKVVIKNVWELWEGLIVLIYSSHAEQGFKLQASRTKANVKVRATVASPLASLALLTVITTSWPRLSFSAILSILFR
jgi:hypothetical protein